MLIDNISVLTTVLAMQWRNVAAFLHWQWDKCNKVNGDLLLVIFCSLVRDCRSTTSTDHRKKWWRCTVHKLCLPSLYRPSRSLQNLNIKLLKKDDDTVLKLDLIYRPSQNGQNKCNIEKMTIIWPDMLSKITKLMQYWNKWRQCSRPTQIM